MADIQQATELLARAIAAQAQGTPQSGGQEPLTPGATTCTEVILAAVTQLESKVAHKKQALQGAIMMLLNRPAHGGFYPGGCSGASVLLGILQAFMRGESKVLTTGMLPIICHHVTQRHDYCEKACHWVRSNTGLKLQLAYEEVAGQEQGTFHLV